MVRSFPRAGPAAATVDSPQAWLVVASTAVATFTVFGVTYSFGTFFSAMADDFATDKGATALLFGLTIFFLFVLSLPAGHYTDRFGPRPVVGVGAVSMGLGLWLTSLVSSIWLGYLTYGLFVGIATACCYVPMVSQVGAWFDRRRATALGVAVAGIGLGTLVGPPISSALIDAVGWRSTYRLMAIACVVVLALVALTTRRAPVGAAATPPSLRQTFSSRTFQRLYLAAVLMGTALFVPFVFVVPYAEDHDISSGTAATLVSLLGLGSLGGRLVLGAFGARLGVLRLYLVCLTIMAASFAIWLVAGSSFALLALFAIVLGVSYGGYVALSPAICAELFGLVGLGGILGALYTGTGFGGLVGPPIAGWIVDTTGSYTPAILAAMALGAASVIALPPLRSNRR